MMDIFSWTLDKFPGLRRFLIKIDFKTFVVIFFGLSVLSILLMQLKLAQKSELIKSIDAEMGNDMRQTVLTTNVLYTILYGFLLHKISRAGKLSFKLFVILMWFGILSGPMNFIKIYQLRTASKTIEVLPLTLLGHASLIIYFLQSIFGLLYIYQFRQQLGFKSASPRHFHL